ncbi:unnamed protein product [Leptidea sinapis]|uniref:Uncharacterized protein n=1 Tax=Leptidea sinapis TaxID=189913 RepID=A0A5E4PXG2_9NEOP|nr:unnamed protein product [Leptidea sinapis]
MKTLLVILAIFMVALISVTRSNHLDGVEYPVEGVVDSSTEVVELFSGAGVSRQRICTAALCRSVCQSLGFPISFCNIQLICVCRHDIEQHDMKSVVDSSTEVVELFSGAGVSRQRICTAALCRSVCQSLGFPISFCNIQRICVCRHDIEQHDMKSVVDSSTEVVELFSGAGVSRQRICTAALCRSVCQSLGFPISFCNNQRICVCRHDIEQHDMKSVVDSSTEVVELFSGAGVSRQRICTAALCRSVCQSLGFPISFCNIQRICVCRHDIEQHDMKSVVDSSTEVVELFSGAGVSRQRICTAALCRSVCQSLGFPISFCNIQLICVCRR